MEWKSLSASLLGAASIACAHGVPAPPFATPMDRVPAESIQAYLKNLKFDYRDGAGDVQHLLVNCEQSCQLGPLVGIFPEKRIEAQQEQQSGRGCRPDNRPNHQLRHQEPLSSTEPGRGRYGVLGGGFGGTSKPGYVAGTLSLHFYTGNAHPTRLACDHANSPVVRASGLGHQNLGGTVGSRFAQLRGEGRSGGGRRRGNPLDARNDDLG